MLHKKLFMKSFIALYGVTNIGKTTQLALIAE